MRFIFSESGLQRLEEIVKPGVLCMFDFDGTLSPIVPHHEQARLPSDILEHLLALSKHVPVGIITGRAVNDMRSRLPFEPDYVIGNHGLEGVPGWEGRAQHYEAICHGWIEKLTSALSTETFDTGISIEEKCYSLSLHYRSTSDHIKAERQLTELFQTLSPQPHVIRGKCVFNLLPDSEINKGSALAQLMHVTSASSAIYVGDDVTDEDVFRLKRRDILTVRTEPGPDTAAEFFLNNQPEISRFLEELIKRSRSV